MDSFLQQLINGLTLGSIYGLIAIGYTMVFGIIGMINFAHGDVFMLSAFIALIIFIVPRPKIRPRLPPGCVRRRDDRRHGADLGLWNWTIEQARLSAACAARSGSRR